MAMPERVVKEPLPDVLAIAGMSVHAFLKSTKLGDRSFPDIRLDCLKGTGSCRSKACMQGFPARRGS